MNNLKIQKVPIAVTNRLVQAAVRKELVGSLPPAPLGMHPAHAWEDYGTKTLY